MTTEFSGIKPIAFYLPQFYETEYNNEWWGQGFTEWTSARRGERLFPGHHQPQLPPTGENDLGFHNQTDLKILKAQAALAKAYGIYGFCHYFYWFGGRRVLDKPTDLMLANPDVDMPFCLSWANENWSRRWDGGDTDILIPQDYDSERYHELASDLMPYFSDPRYITSGGEVLFLIYRPDEIPDLARLAEEIKKAAIASGHKGAMVLGTETFCLPGQQPDPRENGLDGNVEFPPHGTSTMQVHTIERGDEPAFGGMVFDHFNAFLTTLKRPAPDYPLFRGLFPAWDNTARRGRRANIFAGSSPQLFANWFSAQASWTREHHEVERQFIFLNAWNEWAEGAHFEPDTDNGLAYLETLRGVLSGESPASHPYDWDRGDVEGYRAAAEPVFGLEAFFKAGGFNDDAALPYQLVLPPGAMPPAKTKVAAKAEAKSQPVDNMHLAPKRASWLEHLKRARSLKDVKTALWIGGVHDYPQTGFQKFTTALILGLSKSGKP